MTDAALAAPAPLPAPSPAPSADSARAADPLAQPPPAPAADPVPALLPTVAVPQRRRRPASLAAQLVLLAVLPAFLAMLIGTAVLTRQYLSGVTELMRANAQTVAVQLATSAQVGFAEMDRRALLRLARNGLYQPHVQHVQMWLHDGEILANAEAPDHARNPGVQVVVPVTGEAGDTLGQVMVEMSLDAVQSARRRVWVNGLLVLGAIFFSVGVAGAWAARRIGAPIRRLGEAVDRLGAGERVRVPLEGTAELRHLQAGFNQAAEALAQSQQLLQSRVDAATAELARKNRQLEVASQAKTRLLAAASHDLRQPLHALTLFSDGLANGETDPVRLMRIGHIRECVESLDRLFSELLNLSQLDAGVLQPQWSEFPLDRLFEDISRNFRPVAEQQALRLVVRKTELWVRSDYVMLSRILSNLVSNALRHTHAGGVLVGASRRGGNVRIDVLDTGVGIAPQHQARVFEEFYQVEAPRGEPAADGAVAPCPGRAPRATRGMGLGLATVQRLATLLGAPVRLRSRVGRGTGVSVTVGGATPARAPAPGAVPAAAHQAPARLDGLCVLVIDDERPILEGLQAVLGAAGAQVLAAQTRAEVLALVQRWAGPPDVIVSDLLLEGGDNGIAVLAALRRHPRGIGPGTACLLVTGETKPEHLREAQAAGLAVLHKPVSSQVLRRAILDQLRAVRERS